MKVLRAFFCGLFCLALLGFNTVQALEPELTPAKISLTPLSGQAYILQGASRTTNADAEPSFGPNSQSVRTFQLLQPLDRPLRIYIETGKNSQAPYKSHYREYVNHSLQTWSEALDRRLRYDFVSQRGMADITVDWVSGFSEPLIAGMTYYRVGHARIQIKTTGVPEKDIHANILHEFGHALGISGHSRHADDIMVGIRRWKRDGSYYKPDLSARDIAAIRRLYSAYWEKGEDLYAASSGEAAAANRITRP